jgi:sugar O-acyltransferase (sialic acid O-acetyltransferase NeuD family)
MLLIGAGGHALEALDILLCCGLSEDIQLFDQDKAIVVFQERYRVIHSEEEVKQVFLSDPRFVLSIGNPRIRQRLYDQMTRLGGELFPLRGKENVLSDYASYGETDIFNHTFIGPNTQIGKGCLINTGAQIHHEASIGAFTVVNPGAVVLGGVQIGDLCSIGANATILQQVKIGSNVIVGAGAVVTKDVPDGVTVVGVPARVVR